jgi:hypothetical protein
MTNPYQYVYWLIAARDLSMIFTTSYYNIKIIRQQRISKRLVHGDTDNANALIDFDMLLLSIMPHKYFIKFLQEKMPSHLPYLQMIHICKLY